MNVIDQAIKLITENDIDRGIAYTALTAYLYDSRSVGETLQDDVVTLGMLSISPDDPDFEAIMSTGEHLDSADDVLTVLTAWSKAIAEDPTIESINDLPEVEL